MAAAVDALKKIRTGEVKRHKTNESYWVIINGKVYDVTLFLEEHPGGEEILIENAGTDATVNFEDVGHSTDAQEMMLTYLIGIIDDNDGNGGGGDASSVTTDLITL
ncbi:putative Cytochrome b5 [Hypsibius exemplaris]|uniref:Cytochrome b5 n=1 Tax=Hypsibius exemplaris TaxID=2072580 RepID=A0A1W0X3V8_HYPEX|nr:putative Cytochrome b5 [Hypsibius exemplaris]